MKFEKEITELIELSKHIGEMPDLVQGGGGNTSVKLDNQMMAIKASGVLLKNLAFKNGISFVQYKNIVSYINAYDESKSNQTVNEYIKMQLVPFEDWEVLRPSIETGFHAVLNKYTIHSHSVYANLLACCTDGKDLVKKIFPTAAWVRYLPPGEALTFEIAKIQKNQPTNIYFIQNHGVITTAATKDEALKLHLEVTKEISHHFIFSDYASFENENDDIGFMRDHILFPDQVVYTINDELIHSIAAKETIKSYFYILKSILTNKLKPQFLSKEDAEFIDNMESEKYRRGLIKK